LNYLIFHPKLNFNAMKNRYFLLLFLFIGTAANAQNFAPLGAKWYYDSSGGGTTPRFGAYLLYEVVKDTMVAGTACRKIEVSFMSTRNSSATQRAPLFVYESGDTVYYYHNQLQRFSALYMFNAQAGDTLTFDTPAEFPPADTAQKTWQVLVDSVTSFVQGGDTLKKFWTSPVFVFNETNYAFHEPYIEHIGGTFMFTHQPEAIFPEWDGGIRCFKDGANDLNFMGVACDSLTLLSSVATTGLEQLRFFPNPASDFVQLEQPDKDPVAYQLLDLQGRVHASGSLEFGRHTIGLQDLSNGIYLLMLQQGTAFRYERLVVAK
jgi:hypothetical protein